MLYTHPDISGLLFYLSVWGGVGAQGSEQARVGSEYILTRWDRMQSLGSVEDSSLWPRSKSPYHVCWLPGVPNDPDDGGGRVGEAVAPHVRDFDDQRVLRHFLEGVGRRRSYDYNQKQMFFKYDSCQ